MDYFTNKKFVTWTIIILVLLNVFTLSTIWFAKLVVPVPFPHTFHEERRLPLDNFIEKELGLSDEQNRKFGESRKMHVIRTQDIAREIHMRKKLLFDELFQSSPDTSKIKKLSEEIGMMQTGLEMVNNVHILELKSICNPEQQEKLKFLFNEMLEKSRPDGHRPPPPPHR